MTTYTSTATRGRRIWTVQCDQVPGAISEVTQLTQAAEHQREAIAFVLGVDESEIDDVQVHVDLPDDLQAMLDQLAERATDVDRLTGQLRAERSATARSLRDAGFTVRDIGAVLRVSPQRAHQLLQTEHIEQPA